MGQTLVKYAKARAEERRSDLPQDDALPPREAKALATIQREAKKNKSFLSSGGKGGLPPSLVLGVMRRDGWRCKVCGELGTKENGGLGIHHKYQHITAPKERAKGMEATEEGRRNDPSQMTSICAHCHDSVHQEDRAEFGGEDADQELKAEGKGHAR